MLDPITLCGACIAISKAAISAANEVNLVIRKYVEVPYTIKSIEIHLKLVGQCNSRLESYLNRDLDVFTEDEAEILRMSIEECQNAILYLSRHIEPASSNITFGSKIKHIWNESSLKEAEERLKTQLSAQQALIQIVRLPNHDRPRARQDQHTKSVLGHARRCASIYSGHDQYSVFTAGMDHTSPTERPYQTELANSMAYRMAFLSMMNQSNQSNPFATPSHSYTETSSDVHSQRSNSLSGLSTGLTSISETMSGTPIFGQNKLELVHSTLGNPASNEILTPEKRKNLSQRLGAAAYIGDETKVRQLLQAGADIDFQDDLKYTALSRAVQGGKENIVAILLNAHANSELADDESNRPLDLALEMALCQKRTEVLEALLRHGINPNITRPGRESALITALTRETSPDVTVLSLLLKYNASVTDQNERGITALHVAIYQHKRVAFQELLARKAPASMPDCGGATPLHVASFSRQAWAVAPLVNAGADTEAICRYVVKPKINGYHANEVRSETFHDTWTSLIPPGTGYTTLHFSAASGDIHTVCALLDSGAYVDPLCADGVTPLFLAAAVLSCDEACQDSRRIAYESIMGQLIDHGANVARIQKMCQLKEIALDKDIWSLLHRKPRSPRDWHRDHPITAHGTGQEGSKPSPRTITTNMTDQCQRETGKERKKRSLFKVSTKCSCSKCLSNR